MHDPLQRLYRTKLVLLATLLIVAGIAVLVFSHWAENAAGWDWVTRWPIGDIGSGMFTTGLLGVALQYFDGQDSEERATQRLERVIASATPAMRDAVIDGFAFKPDDLARVATPEVLDQIITNGLAIRLNDPTFASEIYADLQRQAIQMPERLYDARVSIRLSMDRSATKGRAPMFVTVVRWEYALVPTHTVRRFVCTSDLAEFRELNQDTAATSAWFLPAQPGIDAGDKACFELLDFTFNGELQKIRETRKTGSQTYSVSLGEEATASDEAVTVAYTFQTLTPINGHLLQLRMDQPVRGLTVGLDYANTDVGYISVLDFLESSTPTHVTRNDSGQALYVDFDGWVFAKSGIAFVWSNNRK